MKLAFTFIAAILILAKTTIAVDSNTCNIECSFVNGTKEYTGKTSLIAGVGLNTYVVFNIKLKVYAVITVKFNLAFATNGKFLVIFNIKTGVYILLDHKTQLSVHGKAKITFLTSTQKVNYEQLTIQSEEILKQYTSITVANKDAFDFELITAAFYGSQNYDLKSVFRSKELVNLLQENFAEWFVLIKTQITSGCILTSYGYWGFLSVIYDHDFKNSVYITEVLRVSVIYYEEIATDFIALVVNEAMHSIDTYRKTADKITALAILVGNSDKKIFMDYVNNPQYNADVYRITIANVPYEIKVYRVKNSYLIRFSILVNNINMVYHISYINGILFIVNLQSNILLGLQGSSVVIANRTSHLTLVADLSNNLKAKLSAFSNTTFMQLTRNAHGVEVAQHSQQVLVYIKENNSLGHDCNLQAFIEAVVKSNINRVGSLIGSTTLAPEVIKSFRVFLLGIKITTIGKLSLPAFAVGVFGIEVKANVIVQTVAHIFNNIISKGTGFSTFLQFLIKFVVAAEAGSSSG